MMEEKTLIIAADAESARLAASLAERDSAGVCRAGENLLIVATSVKAMNALKDAAAKSRTQLNFKSLDDYCVPKSIWKKVNDAADQMNTVLNTSNNGCRPWYMVGGRDVTAYRLEGAKNIEISLGGMIEYETLAVFNQAIKYATIVEWLIHKEKPGKTILFENNNPAGIAIKNPFEKRDGLEVVPLRKRVLNYINILKIPLEKANEAFLNAFRPKNEVQTSGRRFRILVENLDPKLCDPVIKSLREDGIADALSIVRGINTPKALIADGLPFRYFDSYGLCKGFDKKKARAKLRDSWTALEGNPEFGKNFVVHTSPAECSGGIDVWLAVKPHIEKLFLERFPEICESAEMTYAMLDAEKPKLVLTLDSAGYPSKLTVTLANQMGMETIALAHGLLGSLRSMRGGYERLHSKKEFVWSEYVKHRMVVGKHYPKRGVVVTGNPKLENQMSHWNRIDKKKYRNALFKRLGLDPNKKTVLFAVQPAEQNDAFDSDFEVEKLSNAVLNAIALLPEWQLIIKPHYWMISETSREYGEVIKKMGLHNAVVTKTNIFELMLASDVVIVEQSTAGLEALSLRKLLIVLNLRNEPDHVPYSKFGAATSVHRESDLSGAIERARYDEELANKTLQYFASIGSVHSPSERVALEIKKILKRHVKRTRK